MFSKTVALLALVAVGLAAPQYRTESSSSSSPIGIVNISMDGPNPDGSYQYSYETENGIKANEEGHLVSSNNPENKGDAMSVSGSFSYPGEDGNPIQVTYTADENGFRPAGDHLPVSPPIPDAIVKALEWIAAHPEEDSL